jgi:tetratricopeptide (TPR) repeat protein
MASATSMTFLLEQALLSLHLPPSFEVESTVGRKLAAQAIEGQFKEVLTSDWTKLHSIFVLAEDGRPSISRPLDLDPDGELALLAVAVSLLQAFVQANWTGPELSFSTSSLFPSHQATDEATMDTVSLSHLSRSGEPAYHLAKHPVLLLLALDLFDVSDLPGSTWSHVKTIPVWRLRAGLIHLRILDDPVPLPQSIIDDFSTLVESGIFTKPPPQNVSLDPVSIEAFKDIVPSNTLLLGHYHALLSTLHPPSYRLASVAFTDAATQAGLEYELTGRLGKRTKFQVEDKTQLVLLARGAQREGWAPRTKRDILQIPEQSQQQNETKNDATATIVPLNLDLNDDTLLERTQFTAVSSSSPTSSDGPLSSLDASNQPVLHPLHQSILLSLSLHTSNNSPHYGLTSLQIRAFVERVLSDPENWTVYSMALLLRSRLESDRSRTVERGLWQLQSLVDQLKLDSSPTDEEGVQKEQGAPVKERLTHIYALALPSRWQLEKELANRYISLGVIKSALEIFRRLEMWEEAVRCYATIEQTDKGIEIVRQLLEGRKVDSDVVMRGDKGGERMARERVAKLWCLLGDLESEPEHYQKAWEVSGHGSGRAMRSLGGVLFKAEDYAGAREALRKSVAINPMQVKAWFVLGCAAMLDEDWVTAEEAFGRCTLLDEEDAESWNNLASIHLRRAEKEAFAPSQEEPASDEEDDVVTNGNKSGTTEATGLALPFARKRAAFTCLGQAVKHSYDNWRIWINYMVVAVDVGELSEACRALGRLVEMRGLKDGEAAVDIDVLERLVDAVTRGATDSQNGESSNSARDPNSGKGLEPRVTRLFDAVILPLVSTSSRIFLAHARLLLYKGDIRGALDAHLKAYRAGVARDEGVETDVKKFREAALRVTDVVDALRNLGPKEVQREGGTVEQVAKDWRFQARSILRTFVGRTRGSFEDEPEWARLKEELEELKAEAD